MTGKINLRLKFGTELKIYRTRKKFSQERLAKLTGLHIHMIYLLEHGQRNPSLETIYKLAKALDVKPGKFFRNFGVVLAPLVPIMGAILAQSLDAC